MTRYFLPLVYGILAATILRLLSIMGLLFIGNTTLIVIVLGGFVAGFMCKGGAGGGVKIGLLTGLFTNLLFAFLLGNAIFISFATIFPGIFGGAIGGWMGGMKKTETKQYNGYEPLIMPQSQQENPPLSSKGIKPGTIKRDLMCHACRGRNNITFECPNCTNYYCSDCAPDLNKRCIKCNIELNRRNFSQRSTGRYDCYVCKNGYDSGFKCPKCGKNYCQNCGREAEENCLNCSSMLEKYNY